jgi:hypothetical protein
MDEGTKYVPENKMISTLVLRLIFSVGFLLALLVIVLFDAALAVVG